MKKKRSYIIWIMSIIILFIFFVVITVLFGKKIVTWELYIPSVIGDLTLIATIIPLHSKVIYPYFNDYTKERDFSIFVGRSKESRAIINAINSGEQIIYISGRTGIGKRFLLYKLVDVFHKKEEVLISPSIYPIYVDYKAGENIKQSICERIGVKDELNNPDLVKYLHRLTRSKTIILLIYNVNLKLYLDMVEDINSLTNIDNNLIFIITADRISDMYKPVKMSNFSEKEVKEIASKKKVQITDDICEDIIKKSGGLPILITCLINQLKLTGEISDFAEVSSFISEICEHLNEDQRELLILIAYYSIANTTISKYKLAKYCNICTRQNIEELVKNGLIDYSTHTGEIIIQNFFAQIIQDLFECKRFEKCKWIYEMLDAEEEDCKHKIIFLLLSNEKYMDESKLIDYLSYYLKNKEYYFLIYLFEILDNFHKLNSNYDNKTIQINLLYIYIHSLLEIGEYKKANESLDSLLRSSLNINLRNINSPLAFDINFDIADMSHFFGDFELAIDSYMKLQKSCISEEQEIKCKWAIGHCYRHLGDSNSMNIALSCFEEIVKKKRNANPTYFVRSYQSLVLIKLFYNDISYDYKAAFSDMLNYLNENGIEREKEILSSRQYALYQRIILKDYEASLSTLNSAMQYLEEKGLRIKYDYYFEIAEALRHKIVFHNSEEDYKESLSNYTKALDFSKRAGDISLRNISQLGIILLNLFQKQTNQDDLNNVIEICDFCKEKSILYIYNYAYRIKEYLLNDQYSCEKSTNSNLNSLFKMQLFIM